MGWTARASPVALLVLLFLAVPAAGHGEYIGSDPPANAILPEPPSEITLTLSDALQPGTPSVVVTDAAGLRVDRETRSAPASTT
jgi:methionine-rich copper-binding protein CopC